MATRLKQLIVDRVDLVDKGANPDAHVVLFKRDDSTKAVEPPNDKEAASVADSISKDLDAATARIAELEAERNALAEMSNDDLAALRGFEIAKAEETQIDKSSLPEEVRKALEEGEALRSRVEKMEADNRRADFIRKARDDFGNLANAEDFGPVLEEIDRKAPEAAKALDQMLKAVAARAETSHLFKELGKTVDEADPLATVNARAAEIRKADPKINPADALSQAMAENPEAALAAFDRK